MDIGYKRVVKGLMGIALVVSIGYRLEYGPVLQGQTTDDATRALMEVVTLVSVGLAVLFSIVAVGVIWASFQVNDPTTRHRLQKNALIGGASPVFVAFLIWLTGVPTPI